MKIHYSGGLRFKNWKGSIEMLPGWPCCASGDQAYAVRKRGNQTFNKENVTCKNCLNNIKKAEESSAAKIEGEV